MLEWQNESSLFTIRIQGKQWYWSYKYNSSINSKLSNVYFNVGNNNWLKNQLFTNFFFKNQNNTLHYIFDYEFKRVHKVKLQNNKLKNNSLKYNNVLFSNNNYLNNSIWREFKNIKLSTYLNNIQFKTKNIFTNLNFKYNLGLINNYDLIQTNTKLIKLGYFNKKLTKQNSFNLFLNKNFIKNNFFEIDKLDETFISEDNFRVKKY